MRNYDKWAKSKRGKRRGYESMKSRMQKDEGGYFKYVHACTRRGEVSQKIGCKVRTH